MGRGYAPPAPKNNDPYAAASGLPGYDTAPVMGYGAPHQGSAALPYDESYYSAVNQAQAGRDSFLRSLRNARLEGNQSYHQQMSDLNQQHPYDIGTLNSNFGSSGMGFSSGYGNALGRLQDVFEKNTDRLRQAHLDAIRDIRTNRQNYMGEYRANLAALRQAAADRLAANAGTLGLGKASDANNPTKLANQTTGGKK
jgi:hypothetical protein